jgi:hypothetical protein
VSKADPAAEVVGKRRVFYSCCYISRHCIFRICISLTPALISYFVHFIPERIDTPSSKGIMTKKGKGKSKARGQPDLPASPKGGKPAALAVEYDRETSPKTKKPQTLRNELEGGVALPETGSLTVLKSAGAGRKPSGLMEPPPLPISASEALESNIEGGASPARTPPTGDREYSAIAVRPKVLRRFYEPVLLLHLLGRIRGARTKRPESPDMKHSKQGRRRDFTDNIAYICASNTGGKHVMAAALENTPQGITVWLAANNSKASQNVSAFLHDILTELKDIDVEDEAAQSKTESRMFSKIIQFNKQRVNSYWDNAKHCIVGCLEVIRGSKEFEGVKPFIFSQFSTRTARACEGR